jgi:hypothetical protein
MMPRLSWAAVAAMLLAAVAGCRGQTSRKTPIHLNPNMDQQERFDPQEPNPLFEDGRADRPEVPGTVYVGGLREDDALYRGRSGDQFVDALPVKLDDRLMLRGQERYRIFCVPCHDGAGTGDGMIIRRGMTPPPSLHDPRLRAMPLGQLYDVVANGVRTMPPYAAQIPPEDRWAIVAYVRALQLSGAATLEHVPGDIAASKGWKR